MQSPPRQADNTKVGSQNIKAGRQTVPRQAVSTKVGSQHHGQQILSRQSGRQHQTGRQTLSRHPGRQHQDRQADSTKDRQTAPKTDGQH